MQTSTKRAMLLIASLVLTFIFLRVSLYISPNSNFDVGQYNIHHLFTGLIVLTIGAIPLILFDCGSKVMDFMVIVFGVGLSMALDEWVYLIATDGSDTSYLLPVSFWGGVIVIGLTVLYVGLIWFMEKRKS